MAATFQVKILTVDRQIFEGRATSLVACGRDGYFGILAHHAPLIASLVPGKLSLKDENGRQQSLYLSSGLLEVAANRVKILVRSGERPEEIDYERACRAEERARDRLSVFHGEGGEFDRLFLSLLRALNRKKIAEESGHAKHQS